MGTGVIIPNQFLPNCKCFFHQLKMYVNMWQMPNEILCNLIQIILRKPGRKWLSCCSLCCVAFVLLLYFVFYVCSMSLLLRYNLPSTLQLDFILAIWVSTILDLKFDTKYKSHSKLYECNKIRKYPFPVVIVTSVGIDTFLDYRFIRGGVLPNGR